MSAPTPAARRCSSASRSSAICGPYRIAAVEYEPISVMTNKTPQEAVRGFGQAPTNFALERTMDRVARHLNMDRIAAAAART